MRCARVPNLSPAAGEDDRSTHLAKVADTLPPCDPPRPRLTLNLGITGHRAEILSTGVVAALRTAIDAVFVELREAAARLHDDEKALFDAAAPHIRLHSPLATGADQLAASTARTCGLHDPPSDLRP